MIRPLIRPVTRPVIRRVISLVAGGLLSALVLTVSPAAGGAQPSGEPAYADGQTYLMHSSHVIIGATGGLLDAPPMYVLVFSPPAGSQAGQPITLPFGYQPQCNPCVQEQRFPYHDHLLTGEPGSGTNGTAGDYMSPWRIVIMHYNPAYSNSANFVPLTSDDQLATYESLGYFLPINAGHPGNPYEIWTDTVLICPLVEAG